LTTGQPIDHRSTNRPLVNHLTTGQPFDHRSTRQAASDRPAASSVVNEAAPAASHPFIAAHLAADHAAVAAWADAAR
jgi:hypothetical protein